jgi:hypothetical protein
MRQTKILILLIVYFVCFHSLLRGQGLSEQEGFGKIDAPKITESGKKDSLSSWTNTLSAKLNLSQAGFSNWKSGGENSLTWVSVLDGKFIYRDPKIDFRTQSVFSYGQTKQGSAKFRKNDDLIDISSVVSYLLGFKMDPYFSVTTRTQFDYGRQYIGDSAIEISNFFDPGYLTQNLGFQYLHGTVFDVRVGFSLKQTFSRKFTHFTDDPKTEEIEKVKVQPGAELVSNFNRKFDDLSLKSKFELFADFKGISTVDLRWDTYISYRLLKYIEVSFNFVMYYNLDESKRFQWKEIAAVGLAYDIM